MLASRTAQIGDELANIAIGEALVGLGDAARARLKAAQDDDLLTPSTLDEQLMTYALLHDGPAPRAVLDDAVAAAGAGAGNTLQKAERGGLLQALAALADGKPTDAMAALGPISVETSHTDVVLIWSIAQAQLGHWEDAAKGFSLLDSKAASLGLNAVPAYVRVSLARAQAALGRPADARKAYESLFALWKDADPDLPLLVEARDELGKLGSQ